MSKVVRGPESWFKNRQFTGIRRYKNQVEAEAMQALLVLEGEYTVVAKASEGWVLTPATKAQIDFLLAQVKEDASEGQ